MTQPRGPQDQGYREEVCKIGAGSDTCSFLMYAGAGWDCAKGTDVEPSIRSRRASMSSQGDNCSGPPAFKATRVEADSGSSI